MNTQTGPVRLVQGFLSCLSGSELTYDTAPDPVTFLSCLSGSERCFHRCVDAGAFLSCLSGSERHDDRHWPDLGVSELPIRQ